MTTSTTPPVRTLVAAVEQALAARAEEQEALDAISIQLEALCSDFLRVRGAGDASRLEFRNLLTRRAPGHTDLARPHLLSSELEAQSNAVEVALRDAGVDVGLALRPPVAPDLLETWRKTRAPVEQRTR